ncbi:hypothetical protein F5884DRAFT_455360 [Xylogone sp. PMI_703]|nr:hypothetical protein F5884DRAFT_455360 [Xylogone sp. PMI_703]
MASEADSSASPSKPGQDSSQANTLPEYFTIEDIPGKGKGVVAAQDISPGTCICRENPLFTTASLTSAATQEKDLAAIVRSLPKESQRAFLSLYNNNPGKEPLSNIVRTNAYPLGPGSNIGAIFPVIARFNHSCRPNTQHAWNKILGVETCHVIRAVKKGDELTLSYHAGGPSSTRRQELKTYFGFDCTCEVCSLPEDKLALSDQRLARAQKLDAAIGDPKRVRLLPDRVLKDCKELLNIYREEGIADTRIPRLYWDAFQVAAMHGDKARASVFAERARDARILGEGEGSEDAIEMEGYRKAPGKWEGFAGKGRKWKSEIKDIPKNLSENEFEKWLWKEEK